MLREGRFAGVTLPKWLEEASTSLLVDVAKCGWIPHQLREGRGRADVDRETFCLKLIRTRKRLETNDCFQVVYFSSWQEASTSRELEAVNDGLRPSMAVKHIATGRAFHANLYYLANQFTTNSRYLEGTSRLLNFPYGF